MTTLPCRAADMIQDQLRSQYAGKTLILRNFYSGHKLVFDSTGRLTGKVESGDWPMDGVVRLEKFRISDHRLTIDLRRLHLSAADNFRPSLTYTANLRIDVNFGSDEVTFDKVNEVLAKLFLSSHDSFADLTPDYWKPCVVAAVSGKDTAKYSHCRFSSEFLGIPGVANLSEHSQEFSQSQIPHEDVYSARVGNGVTPPRPAYTPDPKFPHDAPRGAI